VIREEPYSVVNEVVKEIPKYNVEYYEKVVQVKGAGGAGAPDPTPQEAVVQPQGDATQQQALQLIMQQPAFQGMTQQQVINLMAQQSTVQGQATLQEQAALQGQETFQEQATLQGQATFQEQATLQGQATMQQMQQQATMQQQQAGMQLQGFAGEQASMQQMQQQQAGMQLQELALEQARLEQARLQQQIVQQGMVQQQNLQSQRGIAGMGQYSNLQTDYALPGTAVLPGTSNTLVLEPPGARAYSAFAGQQVLRPPPTQTLSQQWFGGQDAGNFDGVENGFNDGRGIERPFDDGRPFQGRRADGRSDGQMWNQVYGTRPKEVATLHKFQDVEEATTAEPQEKNWFDSMIEDLAGV